MSPRTRFSICKPASAPIVVAVLSSTMSKHRVRNLRGCGCGNTIGSSTSLSVIKSSSRNTEIMSAVSSSWTSTSPGNGTTTSIVSVTSSMTGLDNTSMSGIGLVLDSKKEKLLAFIDRSYLPAVGGCGGAWNGS